MSRPRLTAITEPDKASPLAPLYADIIATGFGGDVPLNWFTAQSSRPDILQVSWALTKTLLTAGKLPATVTQMIMTAISAQNNCRYCRVTHSGALEAMGVPTSVISSCVKDVDLTDVPSPHREIVLIAVKAARDPNGMTQDDIEELRDAGLNEGEVAEVLMLAAFANFINTWADASGIEVDGVA